MNSGLENEPKGLDWLLLPFAHGFGLGLLRPAPGTWGSLLGIPLTWALSHLTLGIAVGIWVALVVLGVFACEAAIRHFGVHDPGQCVVDEYLSIPLACMPVFLAGGPIGLTKLAIAFGLFRIFDIWKPWPVRQFERLPGGWGVMLDDLAAALYAALAMWGLMSL